jgi:hypothetical protein
VTDLPAQRRRVVRAVQATILPFRSVTTSEYADGPKAKAPYTVPSRGGFRRALRKKVPRGVGVSRVPTPMR